MKFNLIIKNSIVDHLVQVGVWDQEDQVYFIESELVRFVHGALQLEQIALPYVWL